VSKKTTYILGGSILIGLGVLGWFLYKGSQNASAAIAQAGTNQGNALGSSAVNTLFKDIFGGNSNV
jgi:hypothetical protein